VWGAGPVADRVDRPEFPPRDSSSTTDLDPSGDTQPVAALVESSEGGVSGLVVAKDSPPEFAALGDRLEIAPEADVSKAVVWPAGAAETEMLADDPCRCQAQLNLNWGVPMTSPEAQVLGRLAGRTYAGTVSYVREAHLSVVAGAFGAARAIPGSASVRAVHDAIVGRMYDGVRAAILAAEGLAGGLTPRLAALPAASKQRTNLAVATLNAAVGDRLCDANSALAIRMALRSDGCDVRIRRDTLEAAYSDATPKLAVFLHGLGQTENSWKLHADEYYQDATVTYGSRLAVGSGYTPLYLRYNTGLHISDNGKRLADLLTAVVTAWPTPVEEIVIVAHSMGGLVARSACHYGEQTEEPWIPAVRHVFYLGAPHLGAPLERLTSYWTWALSKTELTRPLASLINRRSAGIKDLRFGYIVDDDWSDCDPDTYLKSHRHNLPLLSTANHFSISATITTGPRHPLGWIFGDLLVPPASANGFHPRNRHIPFEVDHRYHLGHSHHFDLLNHPAVFDAIEAWLQTQPPSGTPPVTTVGNLHPTPPGRGATVAG
jgi:pimeloyl-ACP methyl ester carboxylesterase